MKLLFSVIALGSVALLSANQYALGGGAYSRMQNSSAVYPDSTTSSQYQADAYPYYADEGHQHSPQYSNDQYHQGYDQHYGSPYQQYPQQQHIEIYVEDPSHRQYSPQASYGAPRQSQPQGYYTQNPSAGVPVQAPAQQNGGYYTPKTETINANGNKTVNPDQEIGKKIHDELSSGWFSKGFEDVSFDVSNGVVNLRGSVSSIDDKNKVEENVKKINGVKQLNSQLIVKDRKAPAPAPAPAPGPANFSNRPAPRN